MLVAPVVSALAHLPLQVLSSPLAQRNTFGKFNTLAPAK
jgi:hypothetical protein